MKITHEGWTLFDYDPKLGRQVWYTTNGDGTTTWRSDYEVQPTIDINREQRNLAEKGFRGDYHQIASVPLNIYYDQLAEASKQDDQAHISRWLNDSDNRAWRTKEGTV
ncbi:MAG: hypothetical protein WBC93_15900 [Sulfitobacter sp.]